MAPPRGRSAARSAGASSTGSSGAATKLGGAPTTGFSIAIPAGEALAFGEVWLRPGLPGVGGEGSAEEEGQARHARFRTGRAPLRAFGHTPLEAAGHGIQVIFQTWVRRDGFRSVAVHRSFERLRAVAATLPPELECGLADALIGAGDLPGMPNPLGPTTLLAGAAGPISLGAVKAWRPSGPRIGAGLICGPPRT